MRSATMTRDAAEHFWPANPNADVITAGTAWSGSASASTMIAFLPPISATTRLTWRWPGRCTAAVSLMCRPTAFEPVNTMIATSGCSTSRAPTSSPSPGRNCTVPGGHARAAAPRPAARRSPASARPASGSRGCRRRAPRRSCRTGWRAGSSTARSPRPRPCPGRRAGCARPAATARGRPTPRRAAASRGRSTRRSRSPRTRRRRLGPTACRPRTPRARRAPLRRSRIHAAARNSTAPRSLAGVCRQPSAAASAIRDGDVGVGRGARRAASDHSIRLRGSTLSMVVAVWTTSPAISAGHVDRRARARLVDRHAEERGAAPAPAPLEHGLGLVRGRVRRIVMAGRSRERFERGQVIDIRRGEQLVERAAFGEPVPHEALVARVLEQAAHEIRHARHERTDRRVHAAAAPCA